MANWKVAYNWMMDNEDRNREYKVVPDACPKGCATEHCFAISGINSGAFSQEFASISELTGDARAQAVEDFYHAHFWNQWYEQLASDEVAKRVFDMAVNGGEGASVRILQNAVNSIAPPLSVDGRLGPYTIQAVNHTAPDALVAAFQKVRITHYQFIVAANEEDAQYLAAWATRAMR